VVRGFRKPATLLHAVEVALTAAHSCAGDVRGVVVWLDFLTHPRLLRPRRLRGASEAREDEADRER